MPYVSITGLRLRSWRFWPGFWFHAIGSMAQARRAPGNLSAQARSAEGWQFTLSVWTDRAAMVRYLCDGAHGRAMRIFDAIATGKTYGYETADVPDWAEALAIWREKAVLRDRPPLAGRSGPVTPQPRP